MISALLAVSTPQTTIEFFTCDFVKILRYDADEKAIFGKDHDKLIVFIRRQSRPYSGSSASVLKVIDPSGLLSNRTTSGIVDSDGSVTLHGQWRNSSDPALLIKSAVKGGRGREAWVMRYDSGITSPQQSPLYVGVCNSAAGTVADKLWREAQ